MISLESLFKDRQDSFSLKLVFLIIVIVVLICILNDNFINGFYSYAQQIERTPGFQDSYWTDKTIAAGNDSNKLARERGRTRGGNCHFSYRPC